jgi:hypothetical protein
MICPSISQDNPEFAFLSADRISVQDIVNETMPSFECKVSCDRHRRFCASLTPSIPFLHRSRVFSVAAEPMLSKEAWPESHFQSKTRPLEVNVVAGM